jgi:predicted TIM-barrel fold metal-dependent hydrolase
MPFQIHTGDARIAGSNPMLLVNLIDANPRTKFELFHGGYPWIGETGAIGMKYADHGVPRTHRQRWRCGAV